MVNPGEQFAEAYWQRHGLTAERFSAAEIGRGKTPDFRIFRSGELVAFCEAKHVQYDDWLDEKLKTAKPGEPAGGLRHDPIFNRIVGHIHKAYKQFTAVNSNRRYPNVLVFVNSDKQCDNRDLVAVMTGNAYIKGGRAEPIYTAYSEGRIKEEKFAVDLYLWFDEAKGEGQKGFHYFIADGPHCAPCLALILRSIGARNPVLQTTHRVAARANVNRPSDNGPIIVSRVQRGALEAIRAVCARSIIVVDRTLAAKKNNCESQGCWSSAASIQVTTTPALCAPIVFWASDRGPTSVLYR